MTTLSVNLVPPEVAGEGTWAEKLETILTTAVGGFLLVFLVLAIIWLLLEIIGKAFTKGTVKTPLAEEEKEALPIAYEPPAPAPVAAPTSASSDEEIVAAIMAAISVYTGKPMSRFRVVSFRKKR
jgi:sodium pump decarboxylase gamma subunit